MGKEQFATKIEKELKDNLKKLSDVTRVPQARYVEEALEDLLKKYDHILKKENT